MSASVETRYRIAAMRYSKALAEANAASFGLSVVAQALADQEAEIAGERDEARLEVARLRIIIKRMQARERRKTMRGRRP